MSDVLKSLLESIEHLSTKEKALAAHCLLSSMDSKVENADQEWLALAESRSAELESGKVNAISWNEIKNEIISQMFSISFHPDTKLEVREFFDWYQEQSKGLGYGFIQELEEAFSSIQSLA